MFRRVAVALIVVVLVSTPLLARRRAVRHPSLPPAPSSPYLTEALGAAAWLTSLERQTGPASIGWPRVTGGGAPWAGLEGGAAGISAMFLRLYQSTRDPQWLAKAEGGARFVAEEYRAGRFGGHDWLSGAAGGGDFLLEMYVATGKTEYLDAARSAATWLSDTAIVDGDGIYWKHHPSLTNVYTGLAHGAAGAGLFFLKLHESTGDAHHLEQAERAYRWTARYQLPLPGATLTWKRLTTDTIGYNGWCGGSMGMTTFLERLHGATGKQEYLDAWRATVDGLAALAVQPRPDEVAWGQVPSSGTQGLPIIHCHGTVGIAVTIGEAAAATGEEKYAALVPPAGRWLDRVAVPTAQGSLWPHGAGSSYRNTGLLAGTASVGHASVRLYALTGDASHLARAVAAGEYLLSIADHPVPGQTRWLTHTDSSGPAQYETGWYGGTAGIALFLTELHDALQGRPVAAPFSSLNP